MMRTVALLICVGLLAGGALADDRCTNAITNEPVPATVEGGSCKVKEGGQEMGQGFRAVGRGVRDVFTGEESKGDFKDAKRIGTGAAEVGKGVAGVGRGVGRNVKKAFTDEKGVTEEDAE